MSAPARCALHPDAPATGRCPRCEAPGCSVCLPPHPEPPLCPACRRRRLSRRAKVYAVVGLMVGAPAAVIAWGVHTRLTRPSPGPAASGSNAPRRQTPPRDAAALRLREAEHHSRTGRAPQARALLEALLRERPDHAGALHLYARLQRDAGDHAAVVQYTARLLARHPGAVAPRLWQAEAQVALGEPARAEQTLRDGLRAAPRSGRLALALADRLVATGRAREALSVLRDVLVARPDAEEARVRARLRALEAAPSP